MLGVCSRLTRRAANQRVLGPVSLCWVLTKSRPLHSLLPGLPPTSLDYHSNVVAVLFSLESTSLQLLKDDDDIIGVGKRDKSGL